MRRMHIIDDYNRMGGEIYYKHDKERYMRDPELREAFEAGEECGYEKAMHKMGGYNEKRYDDRGRILYREDRDWDDDDMDYGERRRRSSRTGRYM